MPMFRFPLNGEVDSVLLKEATEGPELANVVHSYVRVVLTVYLEGAMLGA